MPETFSLSEELIKFITEKIISAAQICDPHAFTTGFLCTVFFAASHWSLRQRVGMATGITWVCAMLFDYGVPKDNWSLFVNSMKGAPIGGLLYLVAGEWLEEKLKLKIKTVFSAVCCVLLFDLTGFGVAVPEEKSYSKEDLKRAADESEKPLTDYLIWYFDRKAAEAAEALEDDKKEVEEKANSVEKTTEEGKKEIKALAERTEKTAAQKKKEMEDLKRVIKELLEEEKQ